MTPNRALSFLVIFLVTSGCALAPRAVAVAGKLGGLPTSQAPVLDQPEGAPKMEVILRTKGTSLTMVEADRDAEISVWTSRLGAQIAFQDGLILYTRGLGADLMSSTGPNLALLVTASDPHERVYEFLDGTDQMIRKAYKCSVAVGAPLAGLEQFAHRVETCVSSDNRSIANDYWFTAENRLAISRQWITSGVGYAEISHNVDVN
jgi:hypothetical protein